MPQQCRMKSEKYTHRAKSFMCSKMKFEKKMWRESQVDFSVTVLFFNIKQIHIYKIIPQHTINLKLNNMRDAPKT